MGRGGGRSGGGRSGGFSRGGSRGFSSHRSSSSHRGGSSMRRSPSRPSTPRMPRSPRTPRPVHSGRPIFIPMTTVYRQSGSSGAGSGSKRSSGSIPGWFRWLSGFTCIVIFMLLVFSGFAMIQAKDTPTREKLGPEACIVSTDLIQDELGWISNRSVVEKEMDYFYKKTGVQPYLFITDQINGMGGEITDAEAEAYMESMYNSMYGDEGHMIFTFMEYADSRYITWIYTGVSADSVIDSDAREIFLDNADRYYTDSSLSDDEFFAKIFRQSADMIMKDASGSLVVAKICLIVSILMAIGLAGGFIAFKIAEEKRREAEELKEILETPIGSITSPEEEELLKKYGPTSKEET